MNYEQWLAPEFYNITSEMENHDPGKTALKWLSEQGDYEEISYGDLLAGANRLAGGLSGLGLNKGDRVLVMMPRHINAYVIYVACLKLGLTIIPSSEMLRAKDLAYRLRHSGARAVIAWHNATGEADNIDEEPAVMGISHRGCRKQRNRPRSSRVGYARFIDGRAAGHL